MQAWLQTGRCDHPTSTKEEVISFGRIQIGKSSRANMGHLGMWKCAPMRSDNGWQRPRELVDWTHLLGMCQNRNLDLQHHGFPFGGPSKPPHKKKVIIPTSSHTQKIPKAPSDRLPVALGPHRWNLDFQRKSTWKGLPSSLTTLSGFKGFPS